MKKLLLLITALSVLASCSKDQWNDNGPGSPMNMGKNHYFQAPVITLDPSGGDDTPAFLAAFEEAKTVPGTVIRLVEGEYTISSVEVRDFVGVIKGAGMYKTTIKAAPDLPCWEAAEENNVLSHLLKFIGGDMVMEGLTLRIPDGFACDRETFYGGRDLMTILSVTDWSEVYHPDNMYIKAVIKNVRFIGGNDDGSGGSGPRNVSIGVWTGGDFYFWLEGHDYPFSNTDISIIGCEFYNLLGACEASNMGRDGDFYFTGNYCSSMDLLSFYSGFNYGADITINNNRFENVGWTDLWLYDDDWGTYYYLEREKPTSYNVYGNVFISAPGTTPMLLQEYRLNVMPEFDLPPQEFRIKSNLFNLKEGCIGISAMSSQGAQITNNRFTGVCDLGIYVDATPVTDWTGVEHPAVPARNVLLLGNNLVNLESETADILLGENTTGCTVVGTSARETIVDNGTGNKIVGMSKFEMRNSPAPLIRGAHQNLMKTGRR